MCKIGIMLGTAGENLPSAILFMNSNKSEKNIRKKVAKTREKCLSHGIILGRDVVICKGPDRDVDRDAVNLLISFLMTGQYDMVAVDKLTDLTEDVSNMEELMKDAAKIGVGFLELSTMDYYEYKDVKSAPDNIIPIWDGAAADEDQTRRHTLCGFGWSVSGKYAGRYATCGCCQQ